MVLHRSGLTSGAVQLLDLGPVGVNQELVEVVLGGGLVVVPPATRIGARIWGFPLTETE